MQVARVLPNGNLMVQGEKWLALNKGEEFIQLRGIVRPQDISATNTIPSTLVADARISYGGTGVIDRANSPGWFSKFFNSPLNPFKEIAMLKRSILQMSKPIFVTAVGYLVLVLALSAVLTNDARAERIKDIAMVEGARSNQLVGFGLVVGLDGTGDQVTQTPFTIQAARSMLQQFGVNLPPGINPQTKNMASVMVTAELPPFAKPGQKSRCDSLVCR